jgi:uncharacterized protein YcnI
MAEIYDEENFGPVQHAATTTDVNETSKEDYNDKFDKEQKSIKLGYKQVKAKVKKLCSSFQKAVVVRTRSGSGKIIKEHWESLIKI